LSFVEFIEYLLALSKEWCVLLELKVASDLLLADDCVSGALLETLALGSLMRRGRVITLCGVVLCLLLGVLG
jgi:hypothetical protein